MPTDILEKLCAGQLTGIRRLDLRHCGLTEFPREIFQLADSLEVLDLSDNQLSSLPADLHRLALLQTIFCSDNRFTELPPALGKCGRLDMVGFKANRIVDVPGASLPQALRWLILTDNLIESLPDELGNRPRLQKLMLAGNRLRSLPHALARCERLELLRIAANRLESLPGWLLKLPRLSWIAYGGNPLTPHIAGQAQAPRPDFEWQQIQLGQVLGEGASGVIYQAQLCEGDSCRPVAVKVFKGRLTSDGLPETEMAACLAAGRHGALIGAEGRVTGQPDGRPALLMPLVAPHWRVLAGPPSLQSCTRDVYPETLRLDADKALRIAGAIASAVAHLHRQGLLHGDLYAHNILVDDRGNAMLGDFGAASFLAPGSSADTEKLQQIEARGFGCLLEELRLLTDEKLHGSTMNGLATLESACLDMDPSRRPLFGEIDTTLQRLRCARAY